ATLTLPSTWTRGQVRYECFGLGYRSAEPGAGQLWLGSSAVSSVWATTLSTMRSTRNGSPAGSVLRSLAGECGQQLTEPWGVPARALRRVWVPDLIERGARNCPHRAVSPAFNNSPQLTWQAPAAATAAMAAPARAHMIWAVGLGQVLTEQGSATIRSVNTTAVRPSAAYCPVAM